MYCLVNKIYIEEVIPDSMKTTKLTKLYKRKGALENTTLKRSWSSRLSETIIMLRYGLNASPAVLFSQDHTSGFLTSLTSNGTRCSPRPSWHGELVAWNSGQHGKCITSDMELVLDVFSPYAVALMIGAIRLNAYYMTPRSEDTLTTKRITHS